MVAVSLKNQDASAAFEKLQTIRSFDKLMEFQTDYARSSYEAALARATKIGEIYAELVKDAFKPYENVLGAFNPAKMGAFDPSKFASFTPPVFGLTK